jgi:hypothetical protein
MKARMVVISILITASFLTSIARGELRVQQTRTQPAGSAELDEAKRLDDQVEKL